jgi:16S rRNA (adenine1518-N6/adenine1519-N6)-dimethyltransferase
MVFPPRVSAFAGRKQSSTRDDDVSRGGTPALARARRRFGQNFLTDAVAIRRIVDALAPLPSECVLEIGPGRGALTDALLEAVPAIAAVEVDRDLAALLRSRYPEDRLHLIENDVLDVAFSALTPSAPLVIVGNLAYNISKPVAMKMVVERRAVGRAVLMFQREVADRLTASPGDRAYGPLTILTGRAYRIERLFDLRPGAFRPRPSVVSTVTHWTRREEEALPPDLVAPLMAVLRAAFAHRRQTLQKNLRGVLAGGDAAAVLVLARAGVDGTLRAEAVAPEGFVAIARAWPS